MILKTINGKIFSSTTLILTMVSFFSLQSYAYNQKDVDQFKKINQCLNCDLSNSSVSDNHYEAILEGSNLSRTTISGGFSMSYSNLKNVNGAHSFWGPTNWSYSDFSGSQLIDVDFSGANLENTNFTGAVLIDADFANSDLYKSNVSPEQLSIARSVCNAILPDGSKGKCKN